MDEIRVTTFNGTQEVGNRNLVASHASRFMLRVVQRILLIQLKRLGDFILTLPVLPALRAAHPSAEIVMIVPAAVAGLARCVSQASRVIPYQPGRLNLETWTSTLAGEWDACLDFTGSDRSALLTKLSRATHRLGYVKHARGLRRRAYTGLSEASVRDLHTVDFHLALIAELGIQAEPVADSTIFDFSEEDRSVMPALREAREVREPYAIVHPGTAREEKFWEDERWAEICEYLHSERGLQVLLTGSGDGLEKPHLERLREHLRVPVVNLTGELSLVDLAVLIEGCKVIAGVDSMAMHLASMFRKSQVALFGPTNPFHWRPRHERARVLMPFSDAPVTDFVPKMKRGAMQGISTASVKHALDELIG
jgi:ADP-heptose:LPS heptosyltransferase